MARIILGSGLAVKLKFLPFFTHDQSLSTLVGVAVGDASRLHEWVLRELFQGQRFGEEVALGLASANLSEQL